MEIEGTIIMVLPRQEGTSKTGNPWKKDEYVMETPGMYPRRVKFTVFGQRCDTIKCEMGKSYAVSVDLESREFNGRWYTDVNAFAVREIAAPGQAAPAPAAPAAPAAAAPAAPAAPAFEAPAGDSSDDLPF